MCHETKGRWPCCGRLDVLDVRQCTAGRLLGKLSQCAKTVGVQMMPGWCWRCEAEIKWRLEEAWKAQERREAEEEENAEGKAEGK
ncbi:hypothetical protein MMC30_007927 [Trapelia coarctata]|nr:hypothetical protein [Trapelia coarctata]